jgi:hypothetical protein
MQYNTTVNETEVTQKTGGFNPVQCILQLLPTADIPEHVIEEVLRNNDFDVYLTLSILIGEGYRNNPGPASIGDSEKMECGCCCTEHAASSMVQCTEGHLFCKTCLQKYTENVVFGKILLLDH